MKTKLWTIIAGFLSTGFIFMGAQLVLMHGIISKFHDTNSNEKGFYSLYSLVGARDIVIGLFLLSLVLLNEKKALGTGLIIVALIPLSDIISIMSNDFSNMYRIAIQIVIFVMCLISGYKMMNLAKRQD